MSFSVYPSPTFKRQAKRLAKKHHSLEKDLFAFSDEVSENPRKGISLGNNVYKVRLKITSKTTGKSGGMRVITYVQGREESVYLLAIYDKSELSTLTDKQIRELIKEIE